MRELHLSIFVVVEGRRVVSRWSAIFSATQAPKGKRTIVSATFTRRRFIANVA
jgi:hypothetical protein